MIHARRDSPRPFISHDIGCYTQHRKLPKDYLRRRSQYWKLVTLRMTNRQLVALSPCRRDDHSHITDQTRNQNTNQSPNSAPPHCSFPLPSSPTSVTPQQAPAAHVAASVTLFVSRGTGITHIVPHIATGKLILDHLDRSAIPTELHQDGLECDGPP